jgi:disulfide bond formation protein DsbB
MFCPNCGNQVPDGYKFCNSCGSSMVAPTAQVAMQSRVQEPKRRTGSRRIVGLILIVIGIVLGISAVFVGGGACATTLQSSALLGVPTCDQTTTEIFGLAFFSLAMFIAGLVMVIKSRKRE